MRRFGSRRFIRVRIQKDALKHGSNLKEYFRRPFIVGTAVFRAFFAKEQNVFLVRTNEVVRGPVGEDFHITAPGPGDLTTEIAFMDFIKWHNDLLLNSDQVDPMYISASLCTYMTCRPWRSGLRVLHWVYPTRYLAFVSSGRTLGSRMTSVSDRLIR